MSKDMRHDLEAWRNLARLMPGWRPTLQGLQRLDEGPNELLVALRAIARGWAHQDARWDVLMGVIEFYKREHAHGLAEKIRRELSAPHGQDTAANAADLIDPKKEGQ
jgi:phage gp16-like protein